MALVSLDSVTKEYLSGSERLRVLDEVTVELEAGKIAVVSGESGSGKSTLLNLIAGLDLPSGGRITVGGYRVQALREEDMTDYRTRVVGLVFQFHFLLRDFTALENVMLPAYMAGMKRGAAEKRAFELLGEVGLSDRAHHYPTQLSGGERQRTAVARALVNDPEIILADEPTGNLDVANSRLVQERLFRLVRGYGKTLILVTHDLELATSGDRRFHIEEGRLRES
ncbi:MAG TPA: ABC transporter ATP-binding protein [Spirochaetia bacterium]|nr:ABC transporter ATP-binding protein [Spirochaetia bacterium]